MFINVDYNKRPKEAKLHLAKPNKRVISNIYEKFNDSLAIKLGNINELNFSIPHFITDEDSGEVVLNPHVDMIKEKMLIRVTLDSYKEWYIVDEIQEDSDETDVFNVKAYSLGYELKSKRISGLVEDSINATSLLTKILEPSVWKIGEVDPVFDAMFRSFDSNSDSNSLDCVIQAGETFGALIVWDTIGRKVSFKDMSKNGRFRGMTVSYGRFLRSLTRTRTTDEMVTRLYIYGSEDLTVHSINPTGQGYIEDYSYFIYPFQRDANKNVIQSSYFMSDELCHALLDHKDAITNQSPTIKIKNEDLVAKQTLLISKQSELRDLELELETINGLLDVAKSANDTTAITLRTDEKNAKESEIQAKKLEIIQVENQIATLESEISTIQNNLSSMFTQALIDELNLFTIESTWRDDRYIDVQELYNDGVKKFEELRQPKVVIEVSIDNLLNIVEEQYYWDKLTLGDLIKVKYKEMNIEYMAKIIEINYDLENGEATITIANTTDLLSETDKLVQLLYGSTNASTLIQNNKYKWDKINAVDKQVSAIITQEWDANKQKIIAGVNNSIEVGNRGIIISNPSLPSEIVIMQAGIIALSKDGGETWKTAIKPDGIVAERLIGQIIAGQELIITNNAGSFTIDNNGVRIDASAFVVTSSSGGNLKDVWNSTTNFVDDFKDDNIITAYEKKMLKIEWDKILERYNANTSKLNSYYTNGGSDLLFVNNYHSRYTELYNYLFVELHGDLPLLDTLNMANSSRIDRAIFDARFKNYNIAEVELEEQLSIRAKTLADQALADAKTAQQNINEVMDDIVYKIEIHSSNGFIFKNGVLSTTMTARIFKGKDNITDTLPTSAFIWTKRDKDGVLDTAWNNAHVNVGKQITINKDDVLQRATFECSVDIA